MLFCVSFITASKEIFWNCLLCSLAALLQSSKNLTAQEVALVVFTIFTPFESWESSSSLITENRLLAPIDWLFDDSEGVAAMVDGSDTVSDGLDSNVAVGVTV